MPSRTLPIILLILTMFVNNQLTAQCRAGLPASPCTGSEPLVVNNETINKGTTKWYYGPSVTMNSLTLRGGTLIVCGNLRLLDLVMDSGQIIINTAGRLTVDGGSGIVF